MGVGTLRTDPTRAVFLDRDGVLNRASIRDGKPFPPMSVRDLEILPHVLESLQQLKKRGFLLLVVTNQPDVARGKQTRSTVESMNQALQEKLPIDDVFVCYHDDADRCACRKPKPGLLLQAKSKYGLKLSDCFVIGDRWRDIDAGVRAGCVPIWIDYGYLERGPSSAPAATVRSTQEAVDWIVTREKGRQ